jgi:hypothetical protein
MKLNPEKTEEVIEEFDHITTNNAKAFVYRLFVEVIKGAVGVGMMHEIDVKEDAKNGFYHIDDVKERKELRECITDLQGSLCGGPEQGSDSKINMGALTSALVRMEKAKIPLMKRLIKRDLKANPNTKLIIVVENTDNITDLCRFVNAIGAKEKDQGREQFFALPLDGAVSTKGDPTQRDLVINAFNAPNNECRALVIQVSLAVGISLHDKHGGFPRRMYLIPRYNFSALVQSTGRVKREGTMSDVYIRFVYAYGTDTDQLPRETSILTSIVNKMTVQSEITNGVTAGYPGSYIDVVERSD